MAFSVKLYKSILADMLNWIIGNQDKITDFNEGSVIGSKCEALSRELETVYIKTRVAFGRELKSVPFYAFNFKEEGRAKSSGAEVFSRSGTSGNIAIPLGAVVGTEEGIQFETTEAGQIADGNTDSSNIPIQALKEGREGNVPATTINTLITSITGVETVNNPSSTTGGQNEETSAEFLKRFQEFIEGLSKSSITGLITGAKLVAGVRSASVIEHFPPDSGYNMTVYIDDGAGNASQELIDQVEDILLGDGTKTNPGYKGGGTKLRVLAPTKVPIDVTVEIADDGSLDQIVIEYNVKQAITNYINNLELSKNVVLNKIRAVIMGVVGVADCDITLPTGNTDIGDNQIARTNLITVTFAP